LRVSRRYQGINISSKFFFRKLVQWLYEKILITLLNERNAKFGEVLLLRQDLIKTLPNIQSIISYEGLYIKHIGTIKLEELSKSVHQLVAHSLNHSKFGEILRYIRIYIFSPYFVKWCPLVEFAYNIKSKGDKNFFYIGKTADPIFQILRSIIIENQQNVISTTTASDLVLNFLSETKIWIKKRKLYSYRGFIFHPKKRKYETLNLKKNIVIAIQEERRFQRIAKLCEEFERNGYGVVLYAYEITPDALLELNKYPSLSKRVIFSSDLLSESEVFALQKKIVLGLKTLNLYLKRSIESVDLMYRKVPLQKYVMEDIEEIILFRGMQLEIGGLAIERFLSVQRIDGFISFDNGINTCAWMRACEKHLIPSFLHFYNAALTPMIYKMMIDSFNPTAWMLGGDRQFKKFKELKDDVNCFITGDIFLDQIVNSEHLKLGAEVKRKLGISFNSKVIVLMSSYVIDDFTEERKRILFTTVDIAVKKLGFSLVIRPHPNENIQVLHEQMKDWNISGIASLNESLMNILFASDLVCMYYSEVAQQAMSVGIPVLSLVPDDLSADWDKHWGYYSSGAVKHFSLGEDPALVISDLISDHDSRQHLINKGFEYVKNSFGERDGNNAKRFVDVVKSIC